MCLIAIDHLAVDVLPTLLVLWSVALSRTAVGHNSVEATSEFRSAPIVHDMFGIRSMPELGSWAQDAEVIKHLAEVTDLSSAGSKTTTAPTGLRPSLVDVL
jgi:hypothetical protein